MEKHIKFLPCVVAKKSIFKLANNIGVFPNKVDEAAVGSEYLKIITRQNKSIYFVVNKLAVATFTIVSLLQFIPFLCFPIAPKHNLGDFNSLLALETVTITCGTCLSMYIVYKIFINNEEIVKFFNDWAVIEVDIIGQKFNINSLVAFTF